MNENDEKLCYEIQTMMERMCRAKAYAFAHQIQIRVQSCNSKQRRVQFSVSITKELENIWGIAHGGMLATIFDNCMGCTLRAISGAKTSRTVSLNLTYLRPVPIGADLRVEIVVIKVGRRLAMAEGKAWVHGEEDRLTDAASATFSLQ